MMRLTRKESVTCYLICSVIRRVPCVKPWNRSVDEIRNAAVGLTSLDIGESIACFGGLPTSKEKTTATHPGRRLMNRLRHIATLGAEAKHADSINTYQCHGITAP